MYCKWRDQLLTDGAKLFERGGMDHVRERLEREPRKLKETIGILTVELKRIGKAARREEFSEPGIIGTNPATVMPPLKNGALYTCFYKFFKAFSRSLADCFVLPMRRTVEREGGKSFVLWKFSCFFCRN